MASTNEVQPHEELRVLHRDASVIAIDKPAGLLCVPGRGPDTAPAISALVRSLATDALAVHRLDRDTSGVLLFALGRDAHRALNLSFENRRAEKRYLALCKGDLKVRTLCDLPLLAARAGGMRVARADESGALASTTEFIPVERFGSVTLIEARPRTGRTHQIRVHLAAIGHPLLVDPRYALVEPLAARALDSQALDADEIVLSRTPLHAAAIRLPHPSGRGFLQVESPTPTDFSRCLDLLRAARRRET